MDYLMRKPALHDSCLGVALSHYSILLGIQVLLQLFLWLVVSLRFVDLNSQD